MGLRTFGTRLKALMFPRYLGWGVLSAALPNTSYHYANDVGDGLGSSVVTPLIQWLMRAFPEAPLVVRERLNDELEIVADHPLTVLVERPNPAYPGTLLWMTTLSDWAWYGESFWRIMHGRGGRPEELWWLPPWAVEPKWPQDGSVFISHYDYHPEVGLSIRLELDEVLHFRHGLDPRNPRHGLPPLRAIIRDIWTDDEASNLIATLLRNTGIPGLIVSPRTPEGSISAEEVDRVKAYIAGRFIGDHRGEPLVFGQPTQVERLAWSPDELAISSVKQSAEERVSAALGIPAAVVGFRAGLENSKVGATMHEFVRLAWNNGIIPLQRLLAAELQRVLLPQFELDPDGFLVGWNYDEVAALEEDQNELARRLDLMVKGGWLKVSEARQAMGYEASDEDDIYLRPALIQPVDPDDQMPEPEPLPQPALPPAQAAQNRNGNGNGQPVERRALGTKQGTLEELVQGIIGRQAGRMNNPPRALLRTATRLYREEQKLQPRLQAMILPVLQRYGNMAAVAASEIFVPQKQSLEDIFAMSVLTERLPFISVRAELSETYAAMYELMVEMTLKVLQEELQLTPTDTAHIESQLQMASRERVILLDLPGEAKAAVLKTLEDARLQGLDESQMVELIRQRVPSGRWTSPQMRAEIIARSESRYAANLTTSALARDLGIGRVLVLDARLGPTDPECEARNGWVVSPSQAQALAGIEHPSGTLALLPLTSQTSSLGSGAVAGGVTT